MKHWLNDIIGATLLGAFVALTLAWCAGSAGVPIAPQSVTQWPVDYED